MAVGWFLAPYTIEPPTTEWPKGRRLTPWRPLLARICNEDGGAWAGAECLGNHLVAKIRASEVTLAEIAALPGVARLPKALLSSPLADLTPQQKAAIRNKLEVLGYTLAEIRADLGNDIGERILRDVLRFALKRRFGFRFDEPSQTLVFDGPERPIGKPVESIDSEVSDT